MIRLSDGHVIKINFSEFFHVKITDIKLVSGLSRRTSLVLQRDVKRSGSDDIGSAEESRILRSMIACGEHDYAKTDSSLQGT